MSWQNNRRRKRVWYQRFDSLAEELKTALSAPDVTAADIMVIFYSFSNKMRLFRYNWMMDSAAESMALVISDKSLRAIKIKKEEQL
jgi:hypothetical protein